MIERAFAIHATPREIFAAIERDLEDAAEHAGATHDVLRRERDRSLDMRVTIGAIPCKLTYRLEEQRDYTEVAGTLTPYGWKYAAFNILTFGMRRQIFEIALVEALASLKAAVEEDVARFPDEEGRVASAPDE